MNIWQWLALALAFVGCLGFVFTLGNKHGARTGSLYATRRWFEIDRAQSTCKCPTCHRWHAPERHYE